ncbi:MAG: hypothetical protein INR71_11685, partial [Terriglobus roseus]|nr:hypothetical protein [Terriglobus roseus]
MFQVSSYVAELRGISGAHDGVQPASKKRKLEEPNAAASQSKTEPGAWDDVDAAVAYRAPQVSFSAPQRGKLTLEVIGGSSGGLRAVSAAGGSGKAWDFGLAWTAIDQVFCLPVPEKQRRAWNFVVVPRGNDGVAAPEPGAPEQLVWTYQEPTAKEA